MARSGDGIYDSDMSIEYLAEIIGYLMKETVFRFSPDIIKESSHWVLEALTLFETLAIIDDEYSIRKSYFYERQEVLNRWEQVFFQVWDADWDDAEDDLAYHAPAYRAAHRQQVSYFFDHSKALIAYIENNLSFPPPPFDFEEKLPHFSIKRLKDTRGRDYSLTGSCLNFIIEQIITSTVFMLSEENQERGINPYEIDGLIVRLDVLATLCEKYQVLPGLRPATVDKWLHKVTLLWLEFQDENGFTDVQTLIEKDGFYVTMVEVFVRLNVLARQDTSWNPL